MSRNRMETVTAPAVPRTPTQSDRRQRILDCATQLLSSGGEEAVQMKRVADEAAVSLATLYRYFPSKDHILLAMVSWRFERALKRVTAAGSGGTPAERVRDYLLREFRAQQREPLITAALAKVVSHPDRTHSEVWEQIQSMHLELVTRIARGEDGGLTEAQNLVLPIITGSFGAATRGWIAGVRSAADARFEIRIACRLLDLPAVEIHREKELAKDAGRKG